LRKALLKMTFFSLLEEAGFDGRLAPIDCGLIFLDPAGFLPGN
jgi:hypothetical protein